MKKMTAGLTALSIAAVGVGAWTLYKKANPNAKEDIKNAFSKMARNAENNIENMM